MDKRLEAKVIELEKALTIWATEQGLIGSGQEIVIMVRVREKRPEVTVKRWKLTDSEWELVFSLPLTDFQRAVLQIHRNSGGGIPKDTCVQGAFRGRRVYRRGNPPSDASYWVLNRLFAAAKLPFRFQWRLNRGRLRYVICIAVCSLSS